MIICWRRRILEVGCVMCSGVPFFCCGLVVKGITVMKVSLTEGFATGIYGGRTRFRNLLNERKISRFLARFQISLLDFDGFQATCRDFGPHVWISRFLKDFEDLV